MSIIHVRKARADDALPELPPELTDIWTLLSDEIEEAGAQSAIDALNKLFDSAKVNGGDREILRAYIERAG